MGQYLFIDGASLRKTIERYEKDLFRTPIRLNYLRIGESFEKVYYYDCLPPRGSAEAEEVYAPKCQPQLMLFEHLQTLRGWHVVQGIAKRGRNEAPTQKEVDIHIAVDMLTHTHRRNMSSLTFIANDLDFRPLIDALVRDGMQVNLIFEPGKSSKDLLHAADDRIPLTPQRMHDWLSDESQRQCRVVGMNGVPFDQAKVFSDGGHKVVAEWTSGRVPVQVFAVGDQFHLLRKAHPDSAQIIQLTHADLTYLEAWHELTYAWQDR